MDWEFGAVVTTSLMPENGVYLVPLDRALHRSPIAVEPARRKCPA
ncbi:hypothetical protein [Mycolicibacterium komossense]|nr:hypothetical protein [Mycolicibacterium komossense]